MFSTKRESFKNAFAVTASVVCHSIDGLPALAQGLVGPPTTSCYRYPCDTPYVAASTSNTEYLPLITVMVTLAMGIFVLRARREDPPNWKSAARDLGLLFGVPAIVYTLWHLLNPGL